MGEEGEAKASAEVFGVKKRGGEFGKGGGTLASGDEETFVDGFEAYGENGRTEEGGEAEDEIEEGRRFQVKNLGRDELMRVKISQGIVSASRARSVAVRVSRPDWPSQTTSSPRRGLGTRVTSRRVISMVTRPRMGQRRPWMRA